MKIIKDLLNGIDVLKLIGNENQEILNITNDSRKVIVGSLFICIKGFNKDGNDYIEQAIKNGAVAILTDKVIVYENIITIIVEDTRLSMSIIAKNFYDKPDEKLKIIAVTGTNGKTTTTNIINQMLSLAGYKTGLIGTLGYYINNKLVNQSLTTPDPILLFSLLNDMVKKGVQYVIMEASAHAIALKKLDCLKINIAVFTNLTQDHLDFFKTMEEYEKAKLSLFSHNEIQFKIVNADDECGKKLAILNKNFTISYGIENPSDVFALNIKYENNYTQFILNMMDKIYNLKIPYYGIFNVYNFMAAFITVKLLGVTDKKILSIIKRLKQIDGRFNVYSFKNNKIIIDYAHTPDGLENLLKGCKFFNKPVITVFGCGGNRDKLKRPIMGSIAEKYSDYVILTEDNSRNEKREDIISQINEGIKNKDILKIIPDRKEAIKYAMDKADDSIIVLAGKGAEDYMEINGIKYPYSDKLIVMELMEQIK